MTFNQFILTWVGGGVVFALIQAAVVFIFHPHVLGCL